MFAAKEGPELGSKVANLLSTTLNSVEVEDRGVTMTQNNGIVQGGSDCVAKFSQAIELIVEASIS